MSASDFTIVQISGADHSHGREESGLGSGSFKGFSLHGGQISYQHSSTSATNIGARGLVQFTGQLARKGPAARIKQQTPTLTGYTALFQTVAANTSFASYRVVSGVFTLLASSPVGPGNDVTGVYETRIMVFEDGANTQVKVDARRIATEPELIEYANTIDPSPIVGAGGCGWHELPNGFVAMLADDWIGFEVTI